jgi:excisionase family DNA binding protein
MNTPTPPDMGILGRVLSAAEVCDELGIARSHLNRLTAAGTLPARRIGKKKLVIFRSVLDAFKSALPDAREANLPGPPHLKKRGPKAKMGRAA